MKKMTANNFFLFSPVFFLQFFSKMLSQFLRCLLVFLSVITFLPLSAQNINYAWTIASGSTGIDDGRGIVTDGVNNVYTVGVFTGTVDFDPGIGVTNKTATGSGSGFISKFDANGNLVWNLQISGTVSASCNSICCDNANNIYVIGEVNGTSGDFDPGTGVVNFTSVNYTDVYIAKYTSSGQFVWLQKFGGTGNEYARKIKMGKNGEVAMSSNFDATIDLDPGPGTNNVTSAGSNDVLIARFYSNGNLSWVKTIGNASANLAPGIGIDEKGNIYSAGSFSGTLDTDPNATTTNFLTATGTASDGVILNLILPVFFNGRRN